EYWEWVRTYSSPEYLAIPALKEAMFDKLAAGEDKARLQRLYRRAMRLEASFFSAQPHPPPPRRPAALLTDFDGTCSPAGADSSGAILALAEQAAGGGRPTAGDAAWAARTRAALAAGYQRQYEQLVGPLVGPAEGPAPQSDPAGVAALLERLSEFDEEMNRRVEEAGILKGSTPEEVCAAGSAVPLRPHCREALRAALDRGIPVHVVSVNWSDLLLRAALRLPARRG
ncbi:hypothetical protein Agub_g11165, partial [Astrephomene gubernaculifera]